MDQAETEQDDLIVIGEVEFKNRWINLQNVPIPSIYIQKVEQIKSTYSCFNVKINNHTNNRHGGHGRNGGRGGRNITERGDHPNVRKNHHETKPPDEYPATKSMRPRIGPLFTNTEGKARKNFVAFMNKLSLLNKDEILSNFIKSLIPENINIYMDQMIFLFQVQPTYHDLYTEVIGEIMAISPDQSKVFLEQHFHNFIKEEKYRITDNILEGLESADHNNETSDGLCEYTKWKKNTKSLIVFYIRLISCKMFGSNDDLELLFTVLAKACDEHWNNGKLLEIYLDIMLCSVQSIYKHINGGLLIIPSILDYFCNWDIKKDTLLASSRFKIMDILDIVNKNQSQKPKYQRKNIRGVKK
jgi:hypothetical protein